MPFSLERTVLKTSIKMSCQLKFKLEQFAIQSGREVTVKWLRQFLEALFNRDRSSLYLFSDMR